MGYLCPTEYVAYGLTEETTDDWVTMASALIEAHCRRQSLLVTQYVERMRLTAGSQAVRLSYLPLTPLGTATSPLVGVQVRYGRPRRGELQDPCWRRWRGHSTFQAAGVRSILRAWT
jgi:hypothetical protein